LCRAFVAFVRREADDLGCSERIRPAVRREIGRRGLDDLAGVGLALGAGGAPRGDPVSAEDHADRLRVGALHRGDVESELEAGPPPRHPQHPVAEDLLGQGRPVGGGRDRDAGVGVQVVDVRDVDETVHGGVDARGGPAPAVQAEVERRDHLVLAVDPRVDPGERAQPVEPQYREPLLGERAEVAARALDPEQLGRLAGDRVGLGARGRGVAPGVVGVARVGAEPVAALQKVTHCGVGHEILA
jgi:hypothetical protein